MVIYVCMYTRSEKKECYIRFCRLLSKMILKIKFMLLSQRVVNKLEGILAPKILIWEELKCGLW